MKFKKMDSPNKIKKILKFKSIKKLIIYNNKIKNFRINWIKKLKKFYKDHQ